MKLGLQVKVYDDARIEPDAIVTTQSKSSQEHQLVIRHTWRGDKNDATPPVLSGLPDGWDYSVPVVDNEVKEVDEGLWQQSWRTQISAHHAGTLGDVVTDNTEVRLKVSPDVVSPAGDAYHTNPSKAATGVFRLKAAFENENGESVVAFGRLLIRAPSGVTAPSVAHWGQVEVGSTRMRRIMLSANDDRPFEIKRIWLSHQPAEGDSVLEEVPKKVSATPTDEEEVLWSYKSSDLEFEASTEAGRPNVRQGVQLCLIPLREGELDKDLVFETDHPLGETINIRLRAIVKSVEADH
ncbi:MAG: hypothetical protein KDA93_19030 [Planctomycetaceae bacterium]|nr:hypothetical protein [Planctomycetaceae bacterium]